MKHAKHGCAQLKDLARVEAVARAKHGRSVAVVAAIGHDRLRRIKVAWRIAAPAPVGRRSGEKYGPENIKRAGACRIGDKGSSWVIIYTTNILDAKADEASCDDE